MRSSRALVCLLLVLAALGTAAAASAQGGPNPSSPVPKAIRSKLGEPEKQPSASPFGVLSPRRVDQVKAVVAATTAVLLALGAALRAAGRPDAYRRGRDTALLLLGVAGLACWWNLGRFHFSHYAHHADNYHLFVGARYFPELGYDRLYDCTAVAEAEAGRAASVEKRRMRDLVSNDATRGGAALADRDACKRHFSEPRWQAFRRDVEWFRRHMSQKQWLRTQMDHGYNSTPAWGVLAIPLANLAPASEGQLLLLTLIDPLLLLAMWACITWAFGWRAACVAAVFWGTNPFAHFGWTGGGFLRQDWLAATALAVCLQRRGRHGAAGFALGVAALLRIFPGLLFLAAGLRALPELVRRRRLPPATARFAVGALLAGAVLIPLSFLGSGPDGWPEFVRNSRVHLDTPLQNHMGLPTLLAWQPDARLGVRSDDPFAPWKEARRERFEQREPLFYALLVGYVLLLGWAVAGREPWLATVLGVGLIPVAGELTGYYYAVLLLLGLLWMRQPWVGVGLCALSAGGWMIASRWHAFDDIHALWSAAVLALVLAVTAAFAWGRSLRN
jgi:hypothetical protein